MVLPDGTGTESSQPRRNARWTILVIALGALGVGAVALGALTSPGPVAVATTTTTTTTVPTTTTPLPPSTVIRDEFSVELIETGEPLKWQKVGVVDGVYPLDLVSQNGWLYAFATTTRPWDRSTTRGELRVWRSQDGRSWQDLGAVLGDEHEITEVAATPQGLLALETGHREQGIRLWRSSLGLNWVSQELPTEDIGSFEMLVPTAVAASDDTVFVVGYVSFDVFGVVREYLREKQIDVEPEYGYSLDTTGDDVQTTVFGPLGYPLITVTGKDLGLTPDERESLDSRFRGDNRGVITWISHGEGDWVETEIPDVFRIESAWITGDGTIVATGFDRTGSALWKSTNGRDWESINSSPRLDQVQPAGPGFVGLTNTSRASVLRSDDGLNWETLGLERMLPSPSASTSQWLGRTMAAGPAGIAVAIEGWNPNPPVDYDVADPPVLTDGDAMLTLDYSRNQFTLRKGDREITGQINPNPKLVTGDLITFDPQKQLAVFHDPDNGEQLASFTFDELLEARNSYRFPGYEPAYLAFAFRGDDDNWNIQDMSRIGNGLRFTALEVTGSRVIGLTMRTDGPRGPYDSGFEIWTAAIP